MRRWMFFLIAIILGLAIGLLYGWKIQPVHYTNTPLRSLAEDYQTDYVLMVAEAYFFDHNLGSARSSLADLSDAPTDELLQRAILLAEQAGYNERDLSLMHLLQTDLKPLTQAGTSTP